ncbi:hypothetical protein [Methylobacter marinus]|uniref:hypothetical protein n=1 Tax=Methylobacter marinus TaxID=34058 RepID=UPI00037B227D|nr:hypothetical protein [Methylobacter marinus]
MNKTLDRFLCQKYPHLYRYESPQQTLMGWGFACGDGWYGLIDTVSALLTGHVPDTRAVQVKEKLGGLRFYHAPSNDYSRGVVAMAETMSFATCELCGAPAATYEANHWLATRCRAHVERHNLGGSKHEPAVSSVYGLGLGWSRLVMLLEESVAWDIEKNGMPKATLTIAIKNSRLSIVPAGGDAKTVGMVDFINQYAARIDERTGWPLSC